MEIYEVRFEMYLNNQLIQTAIMTAPKEAIIMNFINLAQQIKNVPEKAKVKMIRPELIWIPWDNKNKVFENVIEIQNYEE